MCGGQLARVSGRSSKIETTGSASGCVDIKGSKRMRRLRGSSVRFPFTVHTDILRSTLAVFPRRLFVSFQPSRPCPQSTHPVPPVRTHQLSLQLLCLTVPSRRLSVLAALSCRSLPQGPHPHPSQPALGPKPPSNQEAIQHSAPAQLHGLSANHTHVSRPAHSLPLVGASKGRFCDV
ncbi:uncharacterized protein EI97DRAFT_5576 [Westerdykella ornata]|uniref:Uncharacterized protein n=1 Tax=Westerdykella ornata TaxID=318751 RepID=A0A6A6JWS5_WESOR|nr:uncharacterized protein EI97DRAFT_5576 [Westerdykella ornata]KAF2280685.1 hypothetical protein EI97DRAFT_5576 [Westerdykella ornata]